MAEIVLDHVSKVYADGTTAVSDLSLDVRDEEFIVLVGPSGCGKTTALRMVAGLESITHGTIAIGDKFVNTVPPKERDTQSRSGDGVMGESQIPSTPSHSRWSRCSITPCRSPVPSPSAKERT
jgi:ABC-type lipoprotein export system ATPase subunit